MKEEIKAKTLTAVHTHTHTHTHTSSLEDYFEYNKIISLNKKTYVLYFVLVSFYKIE